MALYQVKIAYDGTDFKGYQRQNRARTVQSEIESALAQIGWAERTILSAGRTDSGVHAEGQVISFHLDWQHSPQDLLHALNHYLPDDVRAMQAFIADEDFHPRYSARLRRYRYQMYFNDVENPLSERYAWRIWPKPDIEVMKECAELFLGKHDFRNFGKPPNERSSSIRTVQAIELELSEDGSQVDLRISADAFLYHMVRRIVYVLVRAGKGCIGKNEIKECIDRKLELPAGIAPAKGLFLEEIIFS